MQPTRDWIQQEYNSEVSAAITELQLPVRRVLYSLPEMAAAAGMGAATMGGSGGPAMSNGHHHQPAPLLEFEKTASWLNPRLTFDNYVVGSSNQLAHAAARAVASMPSRSYNPLFIYGGVGIGKTHLMHAIGRGLLDNFSGLNVVYTSSERFMNEMINSIKLGSHAGVSSPLSFCGCVAGRRHSHSGRERTDPGRVLPHFQRIV